MTVKELFELAYKLHWSKPRYQHSRWAYEVEKYFVRNIEPIFGSKEVNALTPRMIRHWLSNFHEKPYAGNRSLEVLSKMFSIAEEEEIIALGTNPCRIVKYLPEIKRGRFASEEEIQAISQILKRKVFAERPSRQAVLLLAILHSGARPISLSRAKRSDLKTFMRNGEKWGQIEFIGKSSLETGQKEKVVFPPFIVKLIEHFPPTKCGTLFGVVSYKKIWMQVTKEANCPDLWARDLRRTFATIGMSAGVGVDIVGELLNHSSADTTKVYAKLMDGARVNAVDTIATRLKEMTNDGARAG